MRPYVPGKAQRVGAIQPIGPVVPLKPINRRYFEPSYNERPEMYPAVHAAPFMASAAMSQQLMQQAGKLLERVQHSSEFATKIMDAAQRGLNDEVVRLIRSTGVSADMHMNFTPEGIILKLVSGTAEKTYCELDLKLRWRE
ncbi:Nif11-like leader peptide family natural product precursor [Paenibacillus sp. 481]|uniref:Nif11-like leader peptide family natural product precursor n=1 Tax=Paenibacillus sp. 481 TaxID=2835869 RepID=UPI001E4045CB|nr:Nif11-like leader peptide family natural product precursor [Paenibacillus sp. 481]UHA73847.1 hypothetical protein KIK04_01370 [Paenibacillus sp. 481]